MQIPHAHRMNASRRKNILKKAIESLEQRTMLAVSVDADGWTRVTPSSDTRTIYASSSDGDDTNSGTSSSSPVKTLSRAANLVRSGYPDHLLLKRGDVFNDTFPTWSKSGRNAEEPLLISTYGSDNAARPWVKTGAKRAFYSHTALHDVAIIGIKFEADTRNPDSPDYVSTAGDYGLQIVGPVNGFLVEDSSFDHYVYNVSVQGFSDYATNVKFRRSQFTDSYKAGAQAVGFYASMTKGMLLEENLFDHNGWNEELAPAGNSHNIYFWESSRDVIVRGNIIANGGQHGLQARGGGTIENNLFIRNPIHLLVGNGSTVTPGGVIGKVSGNVFLDSKDINGSGRGWAIELGNIKKGGGSYVRDNIIAQDSQDNFAAIKLETATGAANGSEGVGVNDLVIEDNTIYKWHQGLSIGSGFQPGTTGQRSLNDIVIRDNEFQDILIQKIINHNPSYNGAEEEWSGNTYYSDASSSGWFSIGNKTTSFATWKSTIEPTASNQRIAYADPGRNVGSYNASLGGTATRDAFLAKVRAQSESNWKEIYTASAAIDWIRAGFTGSTPAPEPPPPPPPPPPAPPATPPAPATPPSGANPAGAPAVLWSNFDPAEQTITIRFSEDVSASLSTSDMRLKNLKTSTLIAYSTMKMSYDAGSNTATWSFTDALPVADYKVMLGGGLVHDVDGNKLDGNNDGVAGDDHILKITASELTEATALATMSSLTDPFAPAGDAS